MVENIIMALSHISDDHNIHQELVSHGYVEVVKKYVDLLSNLEASEGSPINFLSLPTGCCELIKSITHTIISLSENSQIHSTLGHTDLLSLLHRMHSLISDDYQIQTMLFEAFGNFLISQDSEIRKKCVRQGFL
jgi:hypothetical protein